MNKFVLVAIVLASISGAGVLSHNVFQIDLQALQVFSSIDEFDDSVCSCEGDDGFFSPENCNGFAPGGDYVDPNGLCTVLASGADYGDPPELVNAQGCGVGFWKNNVATNPSIASIDSSSTSGWPLGYQPDYYYEDMFQTTLVQSESLIAENEDIDTSDENQLSTNDVILENGSENEIKDENEEIAEDENSQAEDGEIHSNDAILEDESEDEQMEPRMNKPDKGPTLLQALESKDGKMSNLLRQSVAAMLNAAHSEIDYPYTVPQIIALTQIALNSEDYQKMADAFEENNENLEKPLLCLE